MNRFCEKFATEILFVFALLLAYLLFKPALSGPFFIDDIVHLSKLAGDGAVTDWNSFLKFVFSGGSASGRPLSFLSMLIESPFWPSDPYQYKRTNLLIHLANSCLLFWFLLLLSRQCVWCRSPKLFAFVAFAIWLLHPIQLSTMMLVIQRMTLVMAFFNLLGLIIYMKGREVYFSGSSHRGAIIMTLGVGIAGLLGALAKDPGVMVAAYVLVIEFLLIKNKPFLRSKFWMLWSGVFLWAVLFALIAMIAIWLGKVNYLFLKRDFSASERVFTEFRVLFDYLKVIVTPQIGSIGPFHDDYVSSQSLLKPISTMLSLLFFVVVLIAAIRVRNVYPPILAGVVWFLAGHSLEASPLPIELYFEHRNYLPMLGWCLISGWLVSQAYLNWGVKSLTIPAIYLSYIVFMSYQSAMIWGSQSLQSLFWSHYHPASWRTTASLVTVNLTSGKFDEAIAELDRYSKFDKNNAGALLLRLTIDACGRNIPTTSETIEKLLKLAEFSKFEHASTSLLRKLTDEKKRGGCPGLPEDMLLEILSAYLSNPHFKGVPNAATEMYLLRASLLSRVGDFEGVMKDFDDAFAISGKYQIAINQAMICLTAGRVDLAEESLKKVESSKDSFLLDSIRSKDLARARLYIEQAKEGVNQGQ